MFSRRQASPGPKRPFQDGVPSSYSMFAGEGVAAILGGMNAVSDKMKGLSIDVKPHQDTGAPLKPTSISTPKAASNSVKNIELPTGNAVPQARLSPNYFSVRSSLPTGVPSKPSAITVGGLSSPSAGGRRNSQTSLENSGVTAIVLNNNNNNSNNTRGPKTNGPISIVLNSPSFTSQRSSTGSFSSASSPTNHAPNMQGANGMINASSSPKNINLSFNRPNSSSNIVGAGKIPRAPGGLEGSSMAAKGSSTSILGGPIPGTLGGGGGNGVMPLSKNGPHGAQQGSFSFGNNIILGGNAAPGNVGIPLGNHPNNVINLNHNSNGSLMNSGSPGNSMATMSSKAFHSHQNNISNNSNSNHGSSSTPSLPEFIHSHHQVPSTQMSNSNNNSGISNSSPINQPPPSLSLSVGSFQSMGARPYQEDFKQILDPAATGNVWHSMLLGTAVYDGHGGKRVSQWLATQYNLLSRAMESLEKWIHDGHSPSESVAPMELVFHECGSMAINKAFTSGSCAAIAIVLRFQGVPWIVAANVGDSRTILVSWDDDSGGINGGGSGWSNPEAVALSVDHKLGPPKTSEETRRVLAAGGSVFQLFGAWRIEGSLAVARAIGDCEFGRYVSYKPTVISQSLRRKDRWIIQASDGLWDVLSNADVAQICKASQGLNATRMSEELVKEAVRVRGSADNTTVVATKLTYR